MCCDNKDDNDYIHISRSFLSEMRNELPFSEFKIFIPLTMYLSSDDGILRVNKDFLTIENYSKDIGCRRKLVQDVFQILEEKGIIAKAVRESKNCYLMNPYIFFHGDWVEKETIDVFSETKWGKINKDCFCEETSLKMCE